MHLGYVAVAAHFEDEAAARGEEGGERWKESGTCGKGRENPVEGGVGEDGCVF